MPGDMTPRAEKYIASVKWQFAKTRPYNPHWYTLKKNAPELAGEFEWFCQHIQDNHYIETFGKVDYKCLIIGEYKYWTCEWPISAITLINRTYWEKEQYAAERKRRIAEHKTAEDKKVKK
jgi:hypothetical protein